MILIVSGNLQCFSETGKRLLKGGLISKVLFKGEGLIGEGRLLEQGSLKE